LSAKTHQRLEVACQHKISEIMKTPEIQKQFRDRGMDLVSTTAPEFTAFLTEEIAKWGRVVKESNIKAE